MRKRNLSKVKYVTTPVHERVFYTYILHQLMREIKHSNVKFVTKYTCVRKDNIKGQVILIHEKMRKRNNSNVILVDTAVP